MGLPTHDLIVQLPAHLLRRSKSLVLVMDRHPQRLNLPTGARESLVPLSDHPLQCHNLILQGSDVSRRHPDLDVEGVTLTADQGNILLQLLHTRQ
jgi:hypothetical protein